MAGWAGLGAAIFPTCRDVLTFFLCQLQKNISPMQRLQFPLSSDRRRAVCKLLEIQKPPGPFCFCVFRPALIVPLKPAFKVFGMAYVQ